MSQSSDRTSVILLCRDQHRNMPLIVDALCRQTRRPDEVIMVDDQSRGDSALLAEQLGCSYVSTRPHCSQGKGAGGRALARQLGTERARYDLLAYLDGDTIPSRRFIDTGCRWAVNNVVAKAARRYRISMDGQVVQNHFDTVDRRVSYSEFYSDSFVIKKGLVLDVGGWDERFQGWGAEDIELAYRLERACVPIVVINGVDSYGIHIDHPVDHAGNHDSLTRNARYFVAKHELLDSTVGEYWTAMNIQLSTYMDMAGGVD
jgi:cellulose synthase/poly-beta-1,6-N-acetylglucosamine synthase-like glycosyltransferase